MSLDVGVDLPAPGPELAALAPAARALVAQVWTERAAAEQRAAFAFTLVARDLLRTGALPEVLALATRAVHDELRHAELCRRLAEGYAGAPVAWPAPVAHGELRGLPPLHQIVISTCISESCGAEVLRVCLADAEAPPARAAIMALLRDDIDHARLGWAHLASGWAPARARATLADALPALLDLVRGAWHRRCGELAPDPPPGHGCATPAAIRAAVDATLRDVVVPGFAHVGVEPGPCRRWLASWCPPGMP